MFFICCWYFKRWLFVRKTCFSFSRSIKKIILFDVVGGTLDSCISFVFFFTSLFLVYEVNVLYFEVKIQCKLTKITFVRDGEIMFEKRGVVKIEGFSLASYRTFYVLNPQAREMVELIVFAIDYLVFLLHTFLKVLTSFWFLRNRTN